MGPFHDGDGSLGKCLHPEIGGTSVPCKFLLVVIIWVPRYKKKKKKRYATMSLKLEIASEQHLFNTAAFLPFRSQHKQPPSMVVPDFPSKSVCVTAKFSFPTYILICAPTFLFLLAVNHLTDRCNYSGSVQTAEVEVNDISIFFPSFNVHKCASLPWQRPTTVCSSL